MKKKNELAVELHDESVDAESATFADFSERRTQSTTPIIMANEA